MSPFKIGSRKPADVIVAGIFLGVLIALGLSVWFGQGFMIVVAALILVFMGSPLFIAVGVATLAGWLLLKDASATTIVSDMFEATKKQEIIAIPFFVLAGNIMTHGSIAKRLIAFPRPSLGHSGGLGVSAVFACAVFAAISEVPLRRSLPSVPSCFQCLSKRDIQRTSRLACCPRRAH